MMIDSLLYDSYYMTSSMTTFIFVYTSLDNFTFAHILRGGSPAVSATTDKGDLVFILIYLTKVVWPQSTSFLFAVYQYVYKLIISKNYKPFLSYITLNVESQICSD